MGAELNNSDLIGIWSNDALYGLGAQSDEMLIFLPDGTGRAESWNWSLNEVIRFTWSLSSGSRITLTSLKYISFTPAGARITAKAGSRIQKNDEFKREACDDFRLIELPISIQSELTPGGKELLVLRIDLGGKSWPKQYGLFSSDISGWEKPRW